MIDYRVNLDIIGKRFGEIVVESFAYTKNNRAYFNVICDCGNKNVSSGKSIRAGKINSCGCATLRNSLKSIVTHGESKTRLYKIWKAMRKRCTNTKIKEYKRYGGRGIRVCDEWNDYLVFRDWALSNGYSDELTIDRYPNNDGNYEPSNCRWATTKQQMNNYSRNYLITFNGKTQSMQMWAEETGIPFHNIQHRLTELGWDAERALTTPVRKMEFKKVNRFSHGLKK